MSTPIDPIFAVALSLTVLHTAVMAPLYWRERHKWPIRGDAQALVLIAAVAQTVEASWTLLSATFFGDLPCVGIFIFKTTPLFLVINCIIMRAWRVWFLYYRAAERVKLPPQRLSLSERANALAASGIGKFVHAQSPKDTKAKRSGHVATLELEATATEQLERGAQTPEGSTTSCKAGVKPDSERSSSSKTCASRTEIGINDTENKHVIDVSTDADQLESSPSRQHHQGGSRAGSTRLVEGSGSSSSCQSTSSAAATGNASGDDTVTGAGAGESTAASAADDGFSEMVSPSVTTIGAGTAASVDIAADVDTAASVNTAADEGFSGVSSSMTTVGAGTAASVDTAVGSKAAAASSPSSSSPSAEERASHWFERNKRYFSQQSLVALAVGLAVFEWVLPAVVFFSLNPGARVTTGQEFCVPQGLVIRDTLFGIIGIYFLFTVFTIWILRNARDGYFIKRELFIDVCIGVCGVCIYLWAQPPVTWYLWFFIGNGILFAQLTWRVIQVHQFERLLVKELAAGQGQDQDRDHDRMAEGKKDAHAPFALAVPRTMSEGAEGDDEVTEVEIREKARRNELTLSDVLRNREFRRQFVEHLTREFSVENFMFYRAAQEFARLCHEGKLPSTDGRNRHAAAIYVTYIDEEAPAQVNLHASVTREIAAAVSSAMPGFNADDFRRTQRLESSASDHRIEDDLFELAVTRTLRLMERDSFVRFKKVAKLQADL